jgi:hypothetical protein
VLQGYFLPVANTEAFDFRFRIEFRITLPVPNNPSRRLDGNTLFITDVASPDNVFSTTLTRSPAGSNRYVTSFVVPAGKTAMVVLLPNIRVPKFFVTTPSDIEIRGYVSLFLPCVFRKVGPLLPLRPAGGRARPRAAERRAPLHLPPADWPATATGDLDFDQTATGLTLASGMGLNEVPQDPCFFFPQRVEEPGSVLERLSRAAVLAADLDEVDAAAGLVGGLARLGPDRENVEAINRVLEQAGIGVRIAPAPQREGEAP